MALAGYSLSASDSSTVASEGRLNTGSGTGYRGAQVSLVTGAGSSASADGSATDTPQWMLWALAGVAAFLILKKGK
jgi:hypothetical protein